MDDIFICPECRATHDEPLEATLGHLALCLACAILAEATAVRPAPLRTLALPAPRTIRPAA
jgi:hypothetical protein